MVVDDLPPPSQLEFQGDSEPRLIRGHLTIRGTFRATSGPPPWVNYSLLPKGRGYALSSADFNTTRKQSRVHCVEPFCSG